LSDPGILEKMRSSAWWLAVECADMTEAVGNLQKALTEILGQPPAVAPSLKRFAQVAWTIEDVKQYRPSWSDEKCEKALSVLEERIEEAMIQAGWQVLVEDLPGSFDDPDGVEEVDPDAPKGHGRNLSVEALYPVADDQEQKNDEA